MDVAEVALLAAQTLAGSLALEAEAPFEAAMKQLFQIVEGSDEEDRLDLAIDIAGQLLPAMQVHERNRVAVKRALLAIHSLVFLGEQEVALGFLEGGAIERIMHTMDLYEGNALLLTKCMETLCPLIDTGPDAILALEAAGGPARITGAMARHEAVVALQAAGCYAICILAVGRDPRVRGLRVVLAEAGAPELVTNAMRMHPNSVDVQERACLAVNNLAMDAANQVALAAAGALSQVVLAMESHRGDTFVQRNACGAIAILARSEQNKTALAADPRALQSIFDAMTEHPNHAEVQKTGCAALMALAANSAENQRMLAGAGAIERILCAMRLHASVFHVQRAACHALWNFAASDVNKVLLAREGAHELLLAALARFANMDTAEGKEWGETIRDEDYDQDEPRLGARRILLLLAESEGAIVGHPWPVVLDYLRIIRLSLNVDAFAVDATTRISCILGAIPIPYLVAHVAVLSFGSELVPAEGWASQVGLEQAQSSLSSRGEAAVCALLVDQLMAIRGTLKAQQQQQQQPRATRRPRRGSC
jgi:hypothetical protein